MPGSRGRQPRSTPTLCRAGPGQGCLPPTASCAASPASALPEAVHSRPGMPEGRYGQKQAGPTGPGSAAAGTPASGWAGLAGASARLTPTLSLCQALRGQTTLPFSAPGSFWGGKGTRLPCWPSARPVSSWGLQGRPQDQPSGGGRREVLGVRRQYPDQNKVAKGRLGEMPTGLPARAGSGYVGGWHWRRPGHFSDRAGVGGSPSGRGCPGAAGCPHPKVVQREEHIPVSVMPGMWLPSQDGEEPSRGLEAGQGALTYRPGKTLQALGEKLRKASPSKAGAS